MSYSLQAFFTQRLTCPSYKINLRIQIPITEKFLTVRCILIIVYWSLWGNLCMHSTDRSLKYQVKPLLHYYSLLYSQCHLFALERHVCSNAIFSLKFQSTFGRFSTEQITHDAFCSFVLLSYITSEQPKLLIIYIYIYNSDRSLAIII